MGTQPYAENFTDITNYYVGPVPPVARFAVSSQLTTHSRVIFFFFSMILHAVATISPPAQVY
jgi:hypothetical protein